MRVKPGFIRRHPNTPKSAIPGKVLSSVQEPSRAAEVSQKSVKMRAFRRPTFWQFFAVVAAMLAVLGVIWSQFNAMRQQQLTENAQVTDEFARAVDQLGSPNVDVRLGGLYTLQHLMRDSSSYEPTIVEVISAYIRDHTFQPATQRGHGTDILTAVNILSSLARQIRTLIDLQGVNLAHKDLKLVNLDHANMIGIQLGGAELFGAHFSGAELYGAQLTGADLKIAQLIGTDLRRAHLHVSKLGGAVLTRADLRGADLTGANLTGATLTRANLTGANLTGANLTGATLTRADLIGAKLIKATVNHAKLSQADLSHADLRGVDLRTTTGLSSNHLKCARVNRLTRLPAGVVVPGCTVAPPKCAVVPPKLPTGRVLNLLLLMRQCR
jgi:uncharacterized protein YjbI with pentapeptide repeats